jgi:hypothetical protein
LMMIRSGPETVDDPSAQTRSRGGDGWADGPDDGYRADDFHEFREFDGPDGPDRLDGLDGLD